MNEYCNIEIQKLASSAASGRYLLGYNGKFFEANSYVVELINCLQEHADEDVAISKYIEKRQGKYTKEQVKGFIEKYLYPLINTDVLQKRKRVRHRLMTHPHDFSGKRSFLFENHISPDAYICCQAIRYI